MVTSDLKAAGDGLSEAERRDLLHYLEQTVEDDYELTDEQIAELKRRDAEIRAGVVEPLSVDQFMHRVRARIR